MATKIRAHVVTATPTYTGQVESEYSAALAIASAHCIMRGIMIDPRFAPGFSLVEYARNWLVAEFLSIKSATHLFWIDADLYFQPDRVATFVNLSLTRDLDVIAGVYTTKTDDTDRRMYPYAALGPVVNDVQEADRVPGGFMCMTRRAVEKVVERCEWHEIDDGGQKRMSPRVFNLVLRGNKLHGEDYIACARLRDAGFKVYVYPDVQFKHWGRKAWPAHLSEQLALEKAEGKVGQGHPDAWKTNTERDTRSVLHQSADSDPSFSEGRDSRRDSAAELGAGGERPADSELISAGATAGGASGGLVDSDKSGGDISAA